MPVKMCKCCNRLQQIKPCDWKLVSCASEHICCADCLKDWLRRQKINRKADWRQYAVPNADYSPQPEFRSDYEMFFADWLTENHISWSYEPFRFPVGGGSYLPDFYSPMYDSFMETKGAWGVGQKTKLKKFIAQYPDLNIVVVHWLCADEIYNEDACVLR